jgi:hypothetical protein
MHYPKLVLRLGLLFLILISLSFCREKKTGFVISMGGADTYECFLDHKPEPFCSIQKKDIPYGAQITYYPKEIKIKEEIAKTRAKEEKLKDEWENIYRELANNTKGPWAQKNMQLL